MVFTKRIKTNKIVQFEDSNYQIRDKCSKSISSTLPNASKKVFL